MELTLIAINCILALGGAIVLYVGIYIRHAGWVDAIRGYWSNISDAVTALIVIGGVIIGLALLGSIAASCHWKFGICTYDIVMVLLLVLFVVVAIAAFILLNKADDWSEKTYPAESMEETVKRDFEKVYCYAQGEHICNEVMFNAALDMFAPEISTTNVSQFENVTGGVSMLCDDYLDDYSELENVCIACDTVREFNNYTMVFDWIHDHCPRTNETMTYCRELIIRTSTTDTTVGTAPYMQCRAEFLEFVENYSLYLGVGSVLVCLGALMVIIFVFCLSRREQLSRNHDELEDSHFTPPTEPIQCVQYVKV
ncbi:unnamed protein product [Peronospora belbahrii]|uniref:Tetraspanin n=1 Tax=Peronospora belbahrii TaxID=622444 RepID=A0AAU9KGF3_9STRA|nr:unnamed protein product [Peronospora belbahrii]